MKNDNTLIIALLLLMWAFLGLQHSQYKSFIKSNLPTTTQTGCDEKEK